VICHHTYQNIKVNLFFLLINKISINKDEKIADKIQRPKQSNIDSSGCIVVIESGDGKDVGRSSEI